MNFKNVPTNDVKKEILGKLSTCNLDENTIKYINDILNSTNSDKISKYLSNIDDSFKLIECIPQHFVQFSDKSSIFTSSDFNQLSFTLPGRKLDISIMNESIIRVFGSIFSSIVLETFLYNLKEIKSLDTLCDHIHNKYVEYGQIYNQIIKEQNQRIEGQTFNTELPDDKEIEHFFSPKNYKKTHFFSKTNEFPKLNTIILNKEYWNVDITKVNSNEYNDVHFCIFKKYHSKYGPVEDSYYMDKFMLDFKDAVDSLFEKNQIQEDFQINNFSQANKELFKESCPVYNEFIGLIRKHIKSSNYQAIKLLKAPIAIFYKKYPNNYEKIAEIFSQAFNIIIPYWEEYDIQY